MKDVKIVGLRDLTTPQVNQAAMLLVNSFYSMFKGISKDREILCRFFAPCMRLDLFHVLLDDDCVAGLIGVSDYEKRAILIDENLCINIWGKAKGKMLTWQLRKILGAPAVCDPESGYIDFLATAPEYRRQGAAQRLLTFAESNSEWRSLYLDVLADNEPAICLYKKLGYETATVKKNIWMRLAGIKTMYIMKKTLK